MQGLVNYQSSDDDDEEKQGQNHEEKIVKNIDSKGNNTVQKNQEHHMTSSLTSSSSQVGGNEQKNLKNSNELHESNLFSNLPTPSTKGELKKKKKRKRRKVQKNLDIVRKLGLGHLFDKEDNIRDDSEEEDQSYKLENIADKRRRLNDVGSKKSLNQASDEEKNDDEFFNSIKDLIGEKKDTFEDIKINNIQMPDMQENSEFMTKFNQTLNQVPSQSTSSKEIPKLSDSQKSKKSKASPSLSTSISGTNFVSKSTNSKGKDPLISTSLNQTEEEQENEELEFEVDATEYENAELDEIQELVDEVQESTGEANSNIEDVTEGIEPSVSGPLPPPLPQDFFSNPSTANQYYQNYIQQQNQKPLPASVLKELSKPGVNVIPVSGTPSQYLDEVERRKMLIEKHRSSIFDSIKPDSTVKKPFSHVGRIRHQITFLAHDIAERELEYAEKVAYAKTNQKKSWKKYGWA